MLLITNVTNGAIYVVMVTVSCLEFLHCLAYIGLPTTTDDHLGSFTHQAICYGVPYTGISHDYHVTFARPCIIQYMTHPSVLAVTTATFPSSLLAVSVDIALLAADIMRRPIIIILQSSHTY